MNGYGTLSSKFYWTIINPVNSFYIWYFRIKLEAIFISVTILLLQVTIAILFILNKNKAKELYPIAFYTVYGLLQILLIYSLIKHLTGKEFLSYRIFTIVEGLSFGYYLTLIIQNSSAKKILISLGVIFLAFALFDLKNSKADTFDSIPTVIECLILLSFSIFYLYEQIKDPNNLFLYNTPNFWIVVGIILFFSGTFFLFIYGQSSSKLPDWDKTFRLINGVCSLLEYILFLIAFIIAKKTINNPKSNLIVKKPGMQF